jgi:CheY-like chemotaxis protein/nitrogen-specific signal transduction histidine kinase
VVDYEQGQPTRMAGVCIMTTRRKEAELARLAAAEEANHLKDEFLATLSHELRTPLNAILGWVQVLQAVEPTPERVTHAIDIIGRNARQQAQLIEDILDVSRIITGKLSVDRYRVNLSHVIDTVVTSATPAAVAKNIQLRKVIPGNLPPISGDSRRMNQVLGNVLNNAIKFTPEGGEVEIRCEHIGQEIEIQVRDSGVGIAPQFLPYIFDRFRQADSRPTRKHSGLGLGLAIARHLLEQHGGRIRADSDGPGTGTTIFMHLPASTVSRAEPAVADPPRDEASDDPCMDVRLDGVDVLVVDDERDSRELLAAMLERCGATVTMADSAASAIARLAEASIQLIIADIAMPDVDGNGLIRRVRRDRRDIAAVAVSAYARPEDRRKALEAGYDGYCAKPVDGAFFLHTVYGVMLAKGLTPGA